LSLDGKMATANGNSQWLSGPESLGYAHYLRQAHDAVLVGYKTVLADNSRLTVRAATLAAYREMAVPLRNPVRIVLDPHWTVLERLADASQPQFALADLSGPFRDNLPKLVIVGSADEPQPDVPHL